jgi:hypothetical protein
MVRFYAYIDVRGIHGGLYPISNIVKQGVLGSIVTLRRGDIFNIKGLGFLRVADFETKYGFVQGTEERYIYIFTEKILPNGVKI